jgi:hypothetical protein
MSQPTSISSLQSFMPSLLRRYFKDATRHFLLQADSSFSQLRYIWASIVLLSYISLFFKISIPTINDFPFLRNIHVWNTWFAKQVYWAIYTLLDGTSSNTDIHEKLVSRDRLWPKGDFTTEALKKYGAVLSH